MNALRFAGAAALFRYTARKRRATYVAAICFLVFSGYYLGTRLGLALTFLPNPISVLWPPNAILFAALLVVPRRLWWVVVAAALPAHLLAELEGGVPLSMVLCWFMSNVAEAAVGALIVESLVHRRLAFDRLLDVSAFVFAAFAAAFLSSFLDSAFVAVIGWGESGYWDTWRTRLLSNVTASVIFVPLIVVWRTIGIDRLQSMRRIRWIEIAALAVGLLAVTLVVFDAQPTMKGAQALIYLPLAFLLWAALRFGPTGATASFAVVSVLVIWGAGHSLGPLGMRQPAENAFSVQLFLIFLGAMLLCLAAALEERRDAERSLRASDRRFQLVLQATRDAVYEQEIATDAVSWSGSGLAHRGYTGSVSPRTFASLLDLVHPQDKARAMRARTAAINCGHALWECEFRLRRGDGSYAHIHEQGLIVRDDAGRAIQMIGALTDITERRDADELNQRLAHASRLTAMGELTASIAHEINQPMSAILSNIDAAEMLLDAGELDRRELGQILSDIRRDDLRASEIIRHIRGLANKRQTDAERFDVNELVRIVLRLVTPTVKRRGVTLDVELNRVPLIHADRIHVQQVLLNLLFNAMDAMSTTPEHDRAIRVVTSSVEPHTIEVRVSDRGHGIPGEDLDRIFDSFFTTKRNGMGLGLSIARSLVEAHGGRIWAENNADAGATFRFTLRVDARRARGVAEH